VACGGQNVKEDNSCGNSSGLSPDSLLRHHRQKAKAVTKIWAKVREVWKVCYVSQEKLPKAVSKPIYQKQVVNRR
jgi:hypothetical protein